jgi:NADH dehydrogenase
MDMNTNNNTRILILGGTGFVGRHVCEQLARLGVYMTVPTRRALNAAAVQSLPRLTVVEADIHDPAQLQALMHGHDAVVNLVAILHGSAAAFQRAHVQLARSIARACVNAGVRRLVHISALGAAQDGPSQYLRSKAGGEAVLHSAGLDLTVLRPSVIFGAEDKFMNVFAQLQSVFPVIPLAGADTRFQPVWVGDVAQAVVHCLQDVHTMDQTYELCGPEVFTLAQLVLNAGRWAGVNHGQGRPVFGMPYTLGWLQAALMELAPGQPLMSRDNLRSMKVDNVATPQQPGLHELHIQPASLAGVAPGYLGARGPRSMLNRLRRAAGR